MSNWAWLYFIFTSAFCSLFYTIWCGIKKGIIVSRLFRWPSSNLLYFELWVFSKVSFFTLTSCVKVQLDFYLLIQNFEMCEKTFVLRERKGKTKNKTLTALFWYNLFDFGRQGRKKKDAISLSICWKASLQFLERNLPSTLGRISPESILPNFDFIVFPIFAFKLGHFKVQTIFSHATNT